MYYSTEINKVSDFDKINFYIYTLDLETNIIKNVVSLNNRLLNIYNKEEQENLKATVSIFIEFEKAMYYLDNYLKGRIS
jgi:hypothetical protein